MSVNELIAKTPRDGSATWLPLPIHLRDTAGIIRHLVAKWLSEGAKRAIIHDIGDEDAFVGLCVFLALIHDLGKATPVFQAMCLAYLSGELASFLKDKLSDSGLYVKPFLEFTSRSSTGHATAGEVLLLDAGCDKSVATIVGAHHGKPSDGGLEADEILEAYGENFFLNSRARANWKAVQSEIIGLALKEAGFSSVEDLPRPQKATQVLLSGLLIMADWIASNETYFPYIPVDCEADSIDQSERVKAAWERLDLSYGWNAGNFWAGNDLYQTRFGYEAKAVQRAVAGIAGRVQTPGVIVIEAPMGVGKTEAALAAAEILANQFSLSGLFFALPTQATSDGIFPRLLNWAKMVSDETVHSIRLAHGMAEFNAAYRELFAGSANISNDAGDAGGVAVHKWFEGRKKALLADFVIGTIDQLLMMALKQKHVMLRHLGLAGKVVIIDECHAYDAYMSRYLLRALNWMGVYKVPVIILSATLPARRRRELVGAYLGDENPNPQDYATSSWGLSRDYPLITYTDGASVFQESPANDLREREIILSKLSDDDIVQTLLEKLEGGGCAGVIVNTVKRSQAIAKELREIFGDDDVILCHSRFIAPDRALIETRVLNAFGPPSASSARPYRLIVVGTQVLEQSLDIDFDILITDLCPMDLLLQRIGRLYRHDRTRPAGLRIAECLILGLSPEGFEKGSRAVYGDFMLMRTKALLPERLTIPFDISALVQRTYDFDDKPASAPSDYAKAESEFMMNIEKARKRADVFKVSPPCDSLKYPRGIIGWLSANLDVTDQRAEAAVRDTSPSIDVLVMVRARDGGISFLPWQEPLRLGRKVDPSACPDADTARRIASQRLRLPTVFCRNPRTLDSVIMELESQYKALFPAWAQSPWLRDELFLLLDENLCGKLLDYRVHYDRLYGLAYEKEGDVIAQE